MRYLMIVPVLETPYLPVQDFRQDWLHYSATWIEWSLSFAGIASFFLFFSLIIKFVPVIPMSGILTNEKNENGNKRKRKIKKAQSTKKEENHYAIH